MPSEVSVLASRTGNMFSVFLTCSFSSFKGSSCVGTVFSDFTHASNTTTCFKSSPLTSKPFSRVK